MVETLIIAPTLNRESKYYPKPQVVPVILDPSLAAFFTLYFPYWHNLALISLYLGLNIRAGMLVGLC